MTVLGSTSFVQYCISWSSLALLYYDYALTFEMEVNCDTWYKIIDVLAVLGRASIIVTFTARTYAVYGQNRYVLIYLAGLGLATVISDSMHVPSQKCNHSEPTPVVSFRTVKAWRAYGRVIAGRKNILYLVFEEGLAYFCIISFFTVATFILKLFLSTHMFFLKRAPPGPYQDILNAFTLPLSGILTARFILHLRGWTEEANAEVQSMSSWVAANRPPSPNARREQGQGHRPPSGVTMSSAQVLNYHPVRQPASPTTPLSDTSTLIPEFGEDPGVTIKRKAHAVHWKAVHPHPSNNGDAISELYTYEEGDNDLRPQNRSRMISV
ncbi:hypothetical protein L218DRAFT_941978 [Marasmius fiardii PR-910]|nr:hypothetical protein L218DRAFT_941978 [Marasmius fiardii PR-910]